MTTNDLNRLAYQFECHAEAGERDGLYPTQQDAFREIECLDRLEKAINTNDGPLTFNGDLVICGDHLPDGHRITGQDLAISIDEDGQLAEFTTSWFRVERVGMPSDDCTQAWEVTVGDALLSVQVRPDQQPVVHIFRGAGNREEIGSTRCAGLTHSNREQGRLAAELAQTTAGLEVISDLHRKAVRMLCRDFGLSLSDPLTMHAVDAALVAAGRYKKANARVVELDGLLLNLLAVIHRDGGQHTDAVGIAQSVEDAEARYYALATAEHEHLTETAGLVSNANAVREQHSARVDRLLGQVEALTAEVKRLRARVRVETKDVERAAVSWDQLERWVAVSGSSDIVQSLSGRSMTLRDAINCIAARVSRPGLDILDEIAATEPPP